MRITADLFYVGPSDNVEPVPDTLHIEFDNKSVVCTRTNFGSENPDMIVIDADPLDGESAELVASALVDIGAHPSHLDDFVWHLINLLHGEEV